MSGLGARAERIARKVQKDRRQRKLEAGESGWGPPTLAPPVLPAHLPRPYRVVVVGAGAQGSTLASAVGDVGGMALVGVVDLDVERARVLAARIGPDVDAAADILSASGSIAPDLVVVATTAPHHVVVGRSALAAGAKRILLEKPIDNSYEDSVAFTTECAAAGVPLGINYFRRSTPDYRRLVDVVRSGAIGTVRVITAQPGAGELAMLASHYVDFARLLLDDEVASVAASLQAPAAGNKRGTEFDDPTGNLTATFRAGARLYIDVGHDLPAWVGFLTIHGDLGTIVVEEMAGEWTIRSRSARMWTYPFAERFSPATASRRVLHAMASEPVPACTGEDGIAALEVILGAHHSARDGGRSISLPLDDEQRSLVVRFP